MDVLCGYAKNIVIQEDIIINSLFGISYALETSYSLNLIDRAFESAFLPVIINLYSSNPSLFIKFTKPFLCILGNFLISPKYTKYLIMLKALAIPYDIIYNFIKSDVMHFDRLSEEILILAIWTICNVAADTFENLKTLIDNGYVEMLIEFSKKPELSDQLRQEIVFTMNSICSGCDGDYVIKIVKLGVIENLYYNLINIKSYKGILVIFEALKSLFQHGEYMVESNLKTVNPYVRRFEEIGGMDIINKLQNHDHPEIAKISRILIKKFTKGDCNVMDIQ